jgi:hypothetical protein
MRKGEISILKMCTKCNNEYPNTKEYYYSQKDKRTGEIKLSSWCKRCQIENALKNKNINKQREYYHNNKEYWKKYNDEYYKNEDNLIRKQKRERKWRLRNRDKLKEYYEYRQMHKNHEITKEELSLLYDYCNSSCMYCGITEENALIKQGQKLHRDHAINDGSNGIENCLLACRSCNTSKNRRDWHEWYIKDNPVFYIERYEVIVYWLTLFEDNIFEEKE